jgi:hypothetical protein
MSVSNPFITASTMIRAMTPRKTPAMEMVVIMEMKNCFLLAFKYLRPMKNSYGIGMEGVSSRLFR